MLKERVIETNEGIQGEITTAEYDMMARRMRDMGLTEAKEIIKSGISGGHALEIGPGPGYLGLEWLKYAEDASLTGLEISPDMIIIAQKNACEYGFGEKCEYVAGNAMDMPFEDCSFDAAFSNGSLHEWEDPVKILNETYRVLKNGERAFISDLKRDTLLPLRIFMSALTKKRSMREGLKSSIAAAYTVEELKRIAEKTMFTEADVVSNPFGLYILCRK